MEYWVTVTCIINVEADDEEEARVKAMNKLNEDGALCANDIEIEENWM